MDMDAEALAYTAFYLFSHLCNAGTMAQPHISTLDLLIFSNTHVFTMI